MGSCCCCDMVAGSVFVDIVDLDRDSKSEVYTVISATKIRQSWLVG